jgi:hypothetical protein
MAIGPIGCCMEGCCTAILTEILNIIWSFFEPLVAGMMGGLVPPI